MKSIIAILLALLVLSPAYGAITFVASAGGYSTTAACGNAAIAPASGDDLVAVIETFTSGATFSSVTSTTGPIPITDVAYPISGSGTEYAVYRVHNATAVSQGITVTFAAATECYEWLYDITPVGAFDQVTAVANGSSASFLTNSITPAQNGAFLIAVAGDGGGSVTLSSWTNSFTVNAHTRTIAPTAYTAYLPQTTAASVNAGATISASANWSGLLLDYVPTAISGSVLLSGGKVVLVGGQPVIVP